MTRRVAIWTKTVEFETYAIAKAALPCGYLVDVVTRAKYDSDHSGHRFYYEKLEQYQHIRVLQKAEPLFSPLLST
jgi:hypothetical protein